MNIDGNGHIRDGGVAGVRAPPEFTALPDKFSVDIERKIETKGLPGRDSKTQGNRS